MRYPITNFIGGLIDEDLSLRTDLEDLNTSLHVSINLTPEITGGLKKRKGSVLIDKNKTYKRMFNFNGVLVYVDNELIYVNNQTFSHQFTDLDTLQFINTKDRAFFLQPYLGIYELRYYSNTNDYNYFPFDFKHPALTDNIDPRTKSPGTSIKLDKLEGNNVLVTAEQYKVYDPSVNYFLDDVVLIVRNGNQISPFKMIAATAVGIPPVDANYFEINQAYWERINDIPYYTWDSTVNYSAGAYVYYKGIYYESDINGNLNKPPETHTANDWHVIIPDTSETSIFELDDVGRYIRVNQGVIKIKQVLSNTSQPATYATVNTKVIGDFLVKATALEAIKDSWFISESEFDYVDPITYESKSNLTAMCMIQQRLVLSTDDTIYFSQVANYNNFLTSDITKTGDAFSVNAYSNQTTVIKYLTQWRNGIVVHTDKTLIYVYSDTLISALTMKAEESVYEPVSNCIPKQIQGDVLYIANDRLRSIVYSRDSQGLISSAITNQLKFKENIIKIIQHYDYVYLLTSTGFMYCILYDKVNQVVSISKHQYNRLIIDIEVVNEALYLLTNDGRVLLTTPTLSVYTDETVSLLANKELGMLAYDPTTRTIITNPVDYNSNTRYGYQYQVAIQTTNIDVGRFTGKLTNIDGHQAIKDIVCHVVDTSSFLVNNQDTEIKNGYTGSTRTYENKRISDWTSSDTQEKYRVNILSLSPFNFYIKSITLDIN